MICASCAKQKAPGTIHPKKSRLIPGLTQLMCDDCVKNKMEPRYVLVLYAQQQKNPLAIADYIKHRRYVGRDILLQDVL